MTYRGAGVMQSVGPDTFQQVIVVKLGVCRGWQALRVLPGACPALLHLSRVGQGGWCVCVWGGGVTLF